MLERITRSLILAILLTLSSVAGAQKMSILNMETYDQDLFHFGFVLGANMSYVTVKPYSNLNEMWFDSIAMPDILPAPNKGRILSINSQPSPGFVISIVSNMRLNKNMDLRFIPSLAFGDRTLNYSIQVFRDTDTTVLFINKKVPSTYINFPLELKIKSDRYNNFRAYALTGVQYTIDLSSQAKKRERQNSSEKIVKFNQNDVYIEGGVGFDFYNEWFKFGLELKMMYGLFNVIKKENNIYTDGIESVKSKVFQVSLTFE